MLKRAVQSYISLILPPNASLFQRTVRFYVFLILLANLGFSALFAMTAVWYTTTLDFPNIALGAIAIEAYAGLFVAFVLIAVLMRSLGAASQRIGFTRGGRARSVKQKQASSLGARLVLVVMPIALLIIAIAVPFAMRWGNIDEVGEHYGISDGSLGFYGDWILTVATLFGAYLTGGFAVLCVLIALFGAKVKRAVTRGALLAGIGLILLANLVALLGFTLFVIDDGITKGAAVNGWTNALIYGSISIFALICISLPPVCVILARQRRGTMRQASSPAYKFAAKGKAILSDYTIGTGNFVALPPNLRFFQRTIFFYFGSALLINLAFPIFVLIALLSGLILIIGGNTGFAPLYLGALGALIGIVIMSFTGFFALFIAAVLLVNLIAEEIRQLGFARRVIRGTKMALTLTRTIKLTVSLISKPMFVAVPAALIVLSSAITYFIFADSTGSIFIVDRQLFSAGNRVPVVILFLMPFITAIAATVFIVIAATNRKSGGTPARDAYEAMGAAIIAAYLTGFCGQIVLMLINVSPERDAAFIYAVVAAFAVIGALALAALLPKGVRRWRERAAANSPEVG